MNVQNEKLVYVAMSISEIAQKLGQKRQGVQRYLEQLLLKELIDFETPETGKRGRPKRIYKIKGFDKNE